MQSTFQSSSSGQAVIQNTTTFGSEQLIVSLHPGADSSVDIQIKEDSPSDNSYVMSSISINQDGLQKLVSWLREQGAVD